MRRLGLLIGAATAFCLGPQAKACLSTESYAYIHSSPPSPLPEGVIVANVEIEPPPKLRDIRAHLVTTGLRARVRRMVQGEYRGELLVIRPVYWSSCDDMYGNGREGLLVGIPRRIEGGTLVVEPVKAWSGDDYRLPDGYQVPPEIFRKAALPPLEPARDQTSFGNLRPWGIVLLLVVAVGAASWIVLIRRSG